MDLSPKISSNPQNMYLIQCQNCDWKTIAQTLQAAERAIWYHESRHYRIGKREIGFSMQRVSEEVLAQQ